MPDWTYDECPSCGEQNGLSVYHCDRCGFEGCWDNDGDGCWPGQEHCPECDEEDPDHRGGLGTWHYVGHIRNSEDGSDEEDDDEENDDEEEKDE